MAKQKFIEKKIVPTMSEALEKILLENVLPNGNIKMDSVRWREAFLWNLGVDDLLKANMEGLKLVFDHLKKYGNRFITLKSLLEYIESLKTIPVSVETVTLAYAFSKM